MSHRAHPSRLLLIPLALALALGGCGTLDAPTSGRGANASVVPGPLSQSSIFWNRTARERIAARAVSSPTTQIRILAYLSIAQHDAILAAEDARGEGTRPTPAAAAAGASLVVLTSFFPLDAALLDAAREAERASASLPGEREADVASGESIGRAMGLRVLAYAATDNTTLTAKPANPGGPGAWTGVNAAKGFYGARTFALASGDQFRPPPPPAFGSPEFDAALAEVRALSDGRTAAQLALAQEWAPRGGAYMNALADDLIARYPRTERDAARLLALMNVAAFDVAVACFDAKLAYYLIRPSQADPAITLPIGLPNHPSYPSGHSCFTAAYATVLEREFPQERARLAALVEEAGLSRMYAGLHFRFDCTAGQELGRNVADWVMHVLGGRGAILPD